VVYLRQGHAIFLNQYTELPVENVPFLMYPNLPAVLEGIIVGMYSMRM